MNSMEKLIQTLNEIGLEGLVHVNKDKNEVYLSGDDELYVTDTSIEKEVPDKRITASGWNFYTIFEFDEQGNFIKVSISD